LILLKARITNIDEWKAILSAIEDVVEDAVFICSKDGITFRGMNSSQMALLDVTFPKSSFDEFVSNNSFFGLKIKDFSTIMNFALSGDLVDLSMSQKTEMSVSIKNKITTEYIIKLIQRKKNKLPIPKVKYKSQLSVESNTLTQILSNIHQISEYVKIHCDSKRVIFSGQGDSGDTKINLNSSNPNLKTLTSTEISSAQYSLEYMAKIIRNIGKTSKIINLEYSNKNPVHIMFDMPSNTKVNYYLAPKT